MEEEYINFSLVTSDLMCSSFSYIVIFVVLLDPHLLCFLLSEVLIIHHIF